MKDKSTILITGATGNLGKALIPKLISNFRVVGCAREDLKKDETRHKNFIFEKINLTSKVKVQQLFKKYQFKQIIHLAALIKRGELNLGETTKVFDSNVISLFNVLSNSEKVDKVIFTSSTAVYGVPQSYRIDENTPTAPSDFYSKSKVFCEELVKYFSQITGSRYIILRIPSIFSKGINEGAIYNFSKNALRNKDIVINVDKPTPWNIIYIDDVVNCIFAASKKKVGNVVINLGYNEEIELERIAKKVKEISMSKSKIIKDYAFANPVFCLDTRKIKGLLGLELPGLDQRLVKYLDDLKVDNES